MSIDPVTMEELLATETAQGSLRPLRAGENVEGTVAAVAGDEATVDLGDRPAGVIPLREAGPEQLRVGEHVIVVVTQAEDFEGRVVLSLRRVRNRAHWAQLEELLASGSVIEAAVLEANRGGVVVDVNLRGFVPLSQLASIRAIDTHEPGVPEPVRRSSGRSEISWEKGIEPTARHRIGDAVRVMVVGLDRDRQRISLSIKRLSADPWERYVDQLETGQAIDATVTRVMPCGAFARVADGVEGLIHIREIANERVTDPNEAVRLGQILPVRIVAIDRERRRLLLSAAPTQGT